MCYVICHLAFEFIDDCLVYSYYSLSLTYKDGYSCHYYRTKFNFHLPVFEWCRVSTSLQNKQWNYTYSLTGVKYNYFQKIGLCFVKSYNSRKCLWDRIVKQRNGITSTKWLSPYNASLGRWVKMNKTDCTKIQMLNKMKTRQKRLQILIHLKKLCNFNGILLNEI